MKIKEFKAVPQEDYPKLPKELWEVLGPVQAQVRELTQLVNGKLGMDNQNSEVVEAKMKPDTEYIFTLNKISGSPRGGCLLLVDSPGKVDMFRLRVVAENKVGLMFTLDPASTSETVARFLILGA